MKLQIKNCKKCGERPFIKRAAEKNSKGEFSDFVFMKCKCGCEGPHVEYNKKKHKDEDLEYLEAAEMWNKNN